MSTKEFAKTLDVYESPNLEIFKFAPGKIVCTSGERTNESYDDEDNYLGIITIDI